MLFCMIKGLEAFLAFNNIWHKVLVTRIFSFSHNLFSKKKIKHFLSYIIFFGLKIFAIYMDQIAVWSSVNPWTVCQDTKFIFLTGNNGTDIE